VSRWAVEEEPAAAPGPAEAGPAAGPASVEVSPIVELVSPALAHEPISGPWQAPDEPELDAAPQPDKSSQVQEDARKLARDAYVSLSRDARHEMEAFVDRANRVTQQMSTAHQTRAEQIISGHDRDQVALDRSADHALSEIDGAAAGAENSLDDASRAARAAIEIAGRRAYALISADDITAAQRIGKVVSGLVSGHLAAFNGAISAVTGASSRALTALNSWRDARAANFPTAGEPVNAAQNEARQLHIPLWVDREATQLGERVKRQTTEWSTARDSTVCGLRCTYRNSLEAERQ
jgi:hypothetical protein